MRKPFQMIAPRRSALRPFSIFAVLYMTAVVLELAEDWESPAFTLFFLVLCAVVIVTGISRIKFATFLVLSTAYSLIGPYPEVANHVNLIIYCNAVMLIALVYAKAHYRQAITDALYFESIRPVLRVSLAAVYFIAGFHKLNADYFDPDVSCADQMFGRVIWTLRSTFLGVPVAYALLVLGLVVLFGLIRSGRFGSPASRVFSALVLLAAGGLFIAVLAVVLQPHLASSFDLGAVGLATGVVVISWELIGGLLLVVPRFHVVMVPVSVAMHAVLAMVGFVDFGALALALLFTFVPMSYLGALSTRAVVHLPRIDVQRVYVFFTINLAGALYAGVDVHLHPLPDRGFVTGALFDLSMLVLVWPVLTAFFSPSPRPVWAGVSLWDGRAPKFLYAFPVLLVLFGMTSYFGLRTAGNFSMFSNLRTEGEKSNHLLLRNNSLKLWTYQEDVVRIFDIDPRAGKVIHHFTQLRNGYELPVVEFRKWIHSWKNAGLKVRATFEYRGQTYSSGDIVNDPQWRTDTRTWEMIFLDFRAIQPVGPNICRW